MRHIFILIRILLVVDMKNRKWLDTEMEGILKIMIVQEINNIPIVHIRLHNDAAGVEKEVILEYELPINFSFDSKLHQNMTAIQIM